MLISCDPDSFLDCPYFIHQNKKGCIAVYDSMHTFRIQNKGINVMILSYMSDIK